MLPKHDQCQTCAMLCLTSCLNKYRVPFINPDRVQSTELNIANLCESYQHFFQLLRTDTNHSLTLDLTSLRSMMSGEKYIQNEGTKPKSSRKDLNYVRIYLGSTVAQLQAQEEVDHSSGD